MRITLYGPEGFLSKTTAAVLMSPAPDGSAIFHCMELQTGVEISEELLGGLLAEERAGAFWLFDRVPDMADVMARVAEEHRLRQEGRELAEERRVAGAAGCLGFGIAVWSGADVADRATWDEVDPLDHIGSANDALEP